MILGSVTEAVLYLKSRPGLLAILLLPVLISIFTLPFGVLPNIVYLLSFLYCLVWFMEAANERRPAWKRAIKIFPRAVLLFGSGVFLVLLLIVLFFIVFPLLSAFYQGCALAYPEWSAYVGFLFPAIVFGFLLLSICFALQAFHWFLFAFSPGLSLKECFVKGLIMWRWKNFWRLILMTLITYVPAYLFFALLSTYQGFTDPLLLLDQSVLQYALDVVLKTYPFMLSIGVLLLSLEYYHGGAE
jgi:hypothetical protein